MLGVLLQVSPPADPALLRAARSAQTRFESVRRMHLPRERSGGSDRCDARIGRYCYTYDSTDATVVPEPAQIAEARQRLLVILADAARANPADGWLAGQRVRYLVEAGRRGDALAVASGCRADRWWCAALAGFALHVDERYADADAAFATALESMSPEQRCDWHDLRRLVPPALARAFGDASCDDRVRLANELWELSVPLFSTTANDLRTEHFSRHTLALIQARAANPHGMSWGNDSRELLLRYGWSEWYTQHEPRSGLYDQGEVIGHGREPSYAFYPDVASLRGVPWIPAEAWRLRAGTAESRYAPRHVRRIVELTHQLARFPRGDSMLVAVAVAVQDSALRDDSVTVTLSALGRAGRTLVRGGLSVSLTIPNDTTIVSIEALGARTKRAARALYSIAPLACDSQLCVSDLLFTRGVDRLSGVDAGLRVALTGMQVRATRSLGLAWEVSASASPEPVRMTLTVEAVEVGFTRRIASKLGLTRLPGPVRMHWTAVSDSSRIETTMLRLPPRARGRHRIHLRVERGGHSASTWREVDLVP